MTKEDNGCDCFYSGSRFCVQCGDCRDCTNDKECEKCENNIDL